MAYSCGIYKIQSVLYPDRCYIGSSAYLGKRLKAHINLLKKNKHHSTYLQNHFNKYGEGDLIFIILEQFDFISKEHLLGREQYYLDSINCVFNVSKTAGSCLGIKYDSDFSEKVSKQFKGKKQSIEHIRKRVESKNGIKLPEDWDGGESKKSPKTGVKKGGKQTPEWIAKRTAHRKGVKMPDDFGKKVSMAKKGVPSKRKGIKRTPKEIEAIKAGMVKSGNVKKGIPPWNKGKKGEYHKKKTGKPAWNRGMESSLWRKSIKGRPSKTKGTTRSEEDRQKMRDGWAKRKKGL